MVTRNMRSGRPTKGGRRLMVRVPESYAEETEFRADALGIPMSDLIATALTIYLDSTPRPAGVGQGELIARGEVLSKTA